MPCPTLISPACKLAEKAVEAGGKKAGHSLVQNGLDAIAQQISEAIKWLVRTTITWWVGVPSIDLHGQPAIQHLHAWFLPIALAVTVAGLIAAGLRMALARKANPLIDVTGGLLVIAVTGAIGTLAPSLLLSAGDAWSNWVLNKSVGEQFGKRMAELLSMSGAASGLVVVLGIVALVLAALQAILMLFRETAILILVGVLPLAAAGAVGPGTRGWIKRVVAWLLALIFYKPAAAAVYATAFTLIGANKAGLRAILMGFCALALSLIALPLLIKLFTFATGSVGQASGSGILGAAVGASVAVGSLRAGGGGGGSAVAQAGYAAGRMPPPAPGDTGGGDGGGPGSPSDGSTTSTTGQGSDKSDAQPEPPAPNDGTGGTPKPPSPPGTGGGTPGPTSVNGATEGAAGSTGAASGTATGAAGAAGPAAAAGAAAAQTTKQTADGARNAAASATTPDGSEQ